MPLIQPWLGNENFDLLTGWTCSLVKVTSIITILCLFEQCDDQLSLIKYSDYQSGGYHMDCCDSGLSVNR